MKNFKITYDDGTFETINAASFDPSASSFGITFYGPSPSQGSDDDDAPAIAFRANMVISPEITGTIRTQKTIAAIDIVA